MKKLKMEVMSRREKVRYSLSVIINKVYLVSYGMQSYLENNDDVEGGDPNKTLEDIFVHTPIGVRGETVSDIHSQFNCRYQRTIFTVYSFHSLSQHFMALL